MEEDAEEKNQTALKQSRSPRGIIFWFDSPTVGHIILIHLILTLYDLARDLNDRNTGLKNTDSVARFSISWGKWGNS